MEQLRALEREFQCASRQLCQQLLVWWQGHSRKAVAGNEQDQVLVQAAGRSTYGKCFQCRRAPSKLAVKGAWCVCAGATSQKARALARQRRSWQSRRRRRSSRRPRPTAGGSWSHTMCPSGCSGSRSSRRPPRSKQVRVCRCRWQRVCGRLLSPHCLHLAGQPCQDFQFFVTDCSDCNDAMTNRRSYLHMRTRICTWQGRPRAAGLSACVTLLAWCLCC